MIEVGAGIIFHPFVRSLDRNPNYLGHCALCNVSDQLYLHSDDRLRRDGQRTRV